MFNQLFQKSHIFNLFFTDNAVDISFGPVLITARLGIIRTPSDTRERKTELQAK